jgi:hypothetical protein
MSEKPTHGPPYPGPPPRDFKPTLPAEERQKCWDGLEVRYLRKEKPTVRSLSEDLAKIRDQLVVLNTSITENMSTINERLDALEEVVEELTRK